MVRTLAIGQTPVTPTAGIDSSGVVVMALGGTAMTKLAVKSGLNPCLAIAIACGTAACMTFGLVNGLRVTRGKPPSFIVSLGTMKIAFVMTQLYSGAPTVTGLPPAKVFFGDTF